MRLVVHGLPELLFANTVVAYNPQFIDPLEDIQIKRRPRASVRHSLIELRNGSGFDFIVELQFVGPELETMNSIFSHWLLNHCF